MTTPGVLAVVVTYNRKVLLARVLDAVAAQTHAPERILVVDNASADGTEAVVEAYDGSVPLEYLRLDHNTGGAGGFSRAVEEALVRDADWAWLMDDDVAPDPDCLEQLLHFREQSECLHPLRIAVDGRPVAWEYGVDYATSATTLLDNTSFAHGKDITFVPGGCFEGMLVSRRVMAAVGPPDAGYFIANDDTLYGMVASLHTNVAFVRTAVMHRLLEAAPPAPWKSYFITRNGFWLARDSWTALGVQPTRTQRLTFMLGRCVEALRLLRGGRRFLVPVARGWRDGRRYLRTGTRPPRD